MSLQSQLAVTRKEPRAGNSITQLLRYDTERTHRDPVVHKRAEAPGHGT